jgi:hypothetical protein
MYTEQLTQGLNFNTPIQPQQLTTTTTVNSGSVDLQYCRRAIFTFNMGTFGGTAPTCSAVAQIQTSPDNATWANEANDSALTISTQATGLTKEIRAGMLTAGKRYARLQVVCTIGGTSPTIPIAGLAIGSEADHKPANAKNDTTVYPTANQSAV